MPDTAWYDLHVQFCTPILGGQPAKESVARDWLVERARKLLGEDEAFDDENPPDVLEGITGFYRMPDDATVPALMDYQVKGALKEAAAAMNPFDGKLRNAKHRFTQWVFVRPRHIPLIGPDGKVLSMGGEVVYNERPIKGMTPSGPRVTLGCSEQLPEGTQFECRLAVLRPAQVTRPILEAALDYLTFMGMGQWRSGGWGTVGEYTLTRA